MRTTNWPTCHQAKDFKPDVSNMDSQLFNRYIHPRRNTVTFLNFVVAQVLYNTGTPTET
jgi:hypothetical protein